MNKKRSKVPFSCTTPVIDSIVIYLSESCFVAVWQLARTYADSLNHRNPGASKKYANHFPRKQCFAWTLSIGNMSDTTIKTTAVTWAVILEISAQTERVLTHELTLNTSWGINVLIKRHYCFQSIPSPPFLSISKPCEAEATFAPPAGLQTCNSKLSALRMQLFANWPSVE